MTLTYDNKIKKVIDIMTIDDMIYLFGDSYEYYMGPFYDEYKNVYHLYTDFLKITKFGLNPDNNKLKINADNLLLKINDIGFKLYVKYLTNLSQVTYDLFRDDYLFDEQIYLFKFSWIYHDLEMFKFIFEKLDGCIKSFIINLLPVENLELLYIFGYPINITSYLLDQGYNNSLGYEIFLDNIEIKFFVQIGLCYNIAENFNPYVEYDKLPYFQNISKTPHFLKKINDYFNSKIFWFRKKHDRLVNIIIHYATNETRTNNIVDIFGKNYKILTFLFEAIQSDNKIKEIICKIFLKNYKFALKSNKINKYINKNLLNQLDDNILINKIEWFNKNFKLFAHKIKLNLIHRYHKLKLLDNLLSINPNNVMVDSLIYKKIKKYLSYIKFELSIQTIRYMVDNGNFKYLCEYIHYDMCCDNMVIVLTDKITNILNTNRKCWYNTITMSKCLNFLKTVNMSEYNKFVINNIEQVCQYLPNDEIINLFVKQNIIDTNKSNYEIYKDLSKYYGKVNINKVIGKLNLPYEKLVGIYKLIYKNRYKCINIVKNILKYKHKMNDELINMLI